MLDTYKDCEKQQSWKADYQTRTNFKKNINCTFLKHDRKKSKKINQSSKILLFLFRSVKVIKKRKFKREATLDIITSYEKKTKKCDFLSEFFEQISKKPQHLSLVGIVLKMSQNYKKQ